MIREGLERAIIGGRDQDGLSEALMAHIAGLRRYAVLLAGNLSDADDMVQESLTRVIGKLKAWREIGDLRSYLFTTLHNVYIDDRRRRSRNLETVPVESVLAHLASPAQQHKRLELRDLIVALGKLPREQREVILLIGLEGMSYQEAAKTLNIPIGTVMSRLSRGREGLRQFMSRGGTHRLRLVK